MVQQNCLELDHLIRRTNAALSKKKNHKSFLLTTRFLSLPSPSFTKHWQVSSDDQRNFNHRKQNVLITKQTPGVRVIYSNKLLLKWVCVQFFRTTLHLCFGIFAELEHSPTFTYYLYVARYVYYSEKWMGLVFHVIWCTCCFGFNKRLPVARSCREMHLKVPLLKGPWWENNRSKGERATTACFWTRKE